MNYDRIIKNLYKREKHLGRECVRIEKECANGQYLAYHRGVLSELQFVLDILDPDMELCDDEMIAEL